MEGGHEELGRFVVLVMREEALRRLCEVDRASFAVHSVEVSMQVVATGLVLLASSASGLIVGGGGAPHASLTRMRAPSVAMPR